MRIALDATYRVDPHPSGIAVYSAQLLDGLASGCPDHEFLHFYRPRQYRRSPKPIEPNVQRRMLLPFGRTGGAHVFHALNQRLDRRMGRRTVATFHDLFVMTADYSTPDFRARFTRQARRAAERADLVIAVSEFTAGQVEELLQVERARLRVIPHGVAQPPATASAREPVVLFVGALQARKNLCRLIEAFETLPPPWRLVLAGAPGGYRADEILERVIRSPGRARIEVTGYLSRHALDGWFARASVFAFPSLDEGFGIPALEAMAWGVPVLTSAGSALKDLANGAALLVNPASVDEIASGLRLLASDGSLRERLIAAGKQRAAEYTWQKAVSRTFAVYREL